VGTTVPAFTASSACAGTQTVFYNNSINGASWLWHFGDGNSDTVQNPTHTYATGGVYNVRLVVYNGVCADSVTVPVTVHPAPAVEFNFTPPLPCPAPRSIQFNNITTGAATYAWDFGDGGSSSLA